MMKSRLTITACAWAAAAALSPAQVLAEDAAPSQQVTVTGKRANRVSKGATGLPMAIKDTPQTISTVDKQDLADFGLTGSNEALALATGIHVEQYETNRATFNARGFDIQLTQVDGLGMTNAWGTVVGREDTFLFERIELIRGANGLLTGVGNASGTINYVRKRPTNEDGGEVNATLGSFGLKRVAVDYNRVLTQDGAWAGRVVLAHEDKDSHVRDLHDRRTTAYGVLDGQIGDQGTLTLGFTAVEARQKSPMWGSLTLLRADGTQADFDVSASTSQTWTYWNTQSHNAFVEYTHALSPDWEAKFTYNVRHGDESTRLLYAYSLTGVLNPDDTGLVGWPYRSEGHSDHTTLDANLQGSFSAGGRQHRLLLGISQSQEKTSVDTFEALNHTGDALPAFPYGGDVYTQPDWGPRAPSTRGRQTLTRAYAATHWTLSEALKGVVGMNAVRLQRSGASIYGNAATNTAYPDTEEISPYVGLTYDLTPDALGYVSYSDIFQNQDQTDIRGRYLAPMKGVNVEAGVKAEWLNKALLTTLAVFSAKQNGLATYAGTITDVPSTDPLYNQAWYAPRDVRSRGVEFELTGRLSQDLKATLGYTHLRLTGPDGQDIYEWVPRDTLNLRVDSRVASVPALRWGVGGRWQSQSRKIGSATQDAYAVANAFAAYALSPAATLRLNLNNLFDQKYVTGLSNGAAYGAPRSVALSVEYKL